MKKVWRRRIAWENGIGWVTKVECVRKSECIGHMSEGGKIRVGYRNNEGKKSRVVVSEWNSVCDEKLVKEK